MGGDGWGGVSFPREQPAAGGVGESSRGRARAAGPGATDDGDTARPWWACSGRALSNASVRGGAYCQGMSSFDEAAPGAEAPGGDTPGDDDAAHPDAARHECAPDGAHTAGRSWHDAAPGPELAATLASLLEGSGQVTDDVGLDALDDYDLVELVAAAQRLASWAHSLAATGAGALAERESMQPTVSALVSKTLTPERIAGEELSMRLGWTPGAGQRLVREGRQYRSHLMPTGEELSRGAIDPAKAKVLRDALDEVPWQLALGVQEMVLPNAPGRTPAQLARDVRAALVALDPVEAVERREKAAADRYVSRPRPLPDGMAGLWLRTTALDAQVLYAAVDSAARAARKAGDPRTLDQLRADLLVERSLHESGCSDPLDLGGKARTTGRSRLTDRPGTHCRSAVRVDVRVLVPLATVVGTEDEPGHLDGYGTIDPEHARALARGGVWRRLVTDPITGTVLDVGRTRYTPPSDLGELVRFRDLSCIHPTCTTSAWQCELDHTVPFRPGATDGGPTAHHNLAPLSKGCHQIKTHAGFDVKRLGPGAYRWDTPTGHTYRVRARSPISSIDGRDPIYEHRHQLEELSPERPRRRTDSSPGSPPATGPPPAEPRASGPPPAARRRDEDDAPPF